MFLCWWYRPTFSCSCFFPCRSARSCSLSDRFCPFLFRRRDNRPSRLCRLLFSWQPSALLAVVGLHGLGHSFDRNSARQKWRLLNLRNVWDRQADVFRLCFVGLVCHASVLADKSTLARILDWPALAAQVLQEFLPVQSKPCFLRQIQPHFNSDRSTPVKRLRVVVIAAMKSVSDRSPSFGHRSVSTGASLPGIGFEHWTKAKAKNRNSAMKIISRVR